MKTAKLAVCANTDCREPHRPNVLGAAKGLCARCYRYSLRHAGQVPPARDEWPEPHVVVSSTLPVSLANMAKAQATRNKLRMAEWVRGVLTRELFREELTNAGR